MTIILLEQGTIKLIGRTHAGEVLDSLYLLDITALRGGEIRTQSLPYVMDCLRVLTLVHIDREGATRVVSYRRASIEEREAYYEWISD